MKKPPMLATQALAQRAGVFSKAALIDVVADLLVRMHGEDGCASDHQVIQAFDEVAVPVMAFRADVYRQALEKGGGR